MNAEKLKELLAIKDESPRCEFKLKYILSGQGKSKALDELAKDIIALANTAGRDIDDFAYLIIGAGNKPNSKGIRDHEDVRPYNYQRKTLLEIVNARSDPKIPDLIYEE